MLQSSATSVDIDAVVPKVSFIVTMNVATG